MSTYAGPVQDLIDELGRLPGVGPKSAQRIAFHLLKGSRDDAARLSAAVGELLESLRTCSICNAITDLEVCSTCSDPGRSDRVICVVEEPHNLVAVERTRDFKGRYHVLHGALSPLQGIGPDELKVQGLLERVRAGGVDEIILATSPTVEGSDGRLPLAPAQAAGGEGHPDRHGHSRGIGPRMGGRGDHGQGPRGASRVLIRTPRAQV